MNAQNAVFFTLGIVSLLILAIAYGMDKGSQGTCHKAAMLFGASLHPEQYDLLKVAKVCP